MFQAKEIPGYRPLRIHAENGKPTWTNENMEFVTWWASNLRPNTDYLRVGHPDRAYPYSVPAFLPSEYLVIQYSDSTNNAKETELYRGMDEKEAMRIFEHATAEYISTNWGGSRQGSGRPSELKKAKLLSFDCPQEMRDRLEVEANRRGKRKAELIREFINQGLCQATEEAMSGTP
jgi:hypothetical protein